MTKKLILENWSYAETLSIESIQSSADKVHLAIRQAGKI